MWLVVLIWQFYDMIIEVESNTYWCDTTHNTYSMYLREMRNTTNDKYTISYTMNNEMKRKVHIFFWRVYRVWRDTVGSFEWWLMTVRLQGPQQAPASSLRTLETVEYQHIFSAVINFFRFSSVSMILTGGTAGTTCGTRCPPSSFELQLLQDHTSCWTHRTW